MAADELHADRDAGEGEEVEFKEWIPPTGEQGKYRQLLDTVSAFANSLPNSVNSIASLVQPEVSSFG